MSAVTVHNKPIWRAAWRRMARRPFQYILFVLGVAIGVAMMVSIDLASGSASRAFELSTSAITGQTTHRLVADSTGLDEVVYTDLRTELGFSPAAPVVEGYVQSPELGEQPLRLIGMDLFAEPPFRSYFGNTGGGDIGDLVAFLAEPNTLLLTEGLAQATGVALGDTITLDYAGQEVPFRIVGLLQPGDEVNQRALSGVLFTDIANAQPLLGLNGRLSYIDLIVNDDADLARIEAFLPEGVRLETASARSNAVQQMTAAFELNLTALSLLALVVGMFLIYNTVSFSVVQRRPLFGILR
ncbi:MAG: ABC transporter permease, partial [Planctomycetales bacterium]|nr:ABC transporter permease [Planctomycetales bacterium]